MNTLLYNLNPVTKIYLMVLFILPVSFSYDIFFPITVLIVLIYAAKLLAGIPICGFYKTMKMIIFSSLCLSLFFMFSRGFSNNGQISFLFFSWHMNDIVLSISLGLRMLVFAYISFIFISTTDAVELVLSLIHILRVPYKAAFAFLAAYRFVPTFYDELNCIITAREARGIDIGGGVFKTVLQIPKTITPLLISAIRKGERMAIAMEARAFGLYDDRTYFKSTSIKQLDCHTIIFATLFVTVLLIIYTVNGLYRFGKSF